MNSTRVRLAGSVVAGFGVLALAVACGGSTSAGSTPQYGAPSGGAAAAGQGGGTTSTVSMRTVNGNQVLVDSAGAALYFNDQDSGGKPKCVSSSCTAVWMPLTVPAGQQPTAGSGITGKVATISVGGKQQVTLNGKPLYTFALDGQPGQVHGNGAGDTFDGTHFTWHSATPSGGSAPASSGSGGGGSGGGYSYGY